MPFNPTELDHKRDSMRIWFPWAAGHRFGPVSRVNLAALIGRLEAQNDALRKDLADLARRVAELERKDGEA